MCNEGSGDTLVAVASASLVASCCCAFAWRENNDYQYDYNCDHQYHRHLRHHCHGFRHLAPTPSYKHPEDSDERDTRAQPAGYEQISCSTLHANTCVWRMSICRCLAAVARDTSSLALACTTVRVPEGVFQVRGRRRATANAATAVAKTPQAEG